MNAFELDRDAFGRWALVLADGTRHMPVTAIRAYPITDPEGGVALMDADGHELLWIDQLAQLAPAVRSQVQQALTERFIGMLIENHAGALPLWLSPVQVSILNITDSQADYALKLEQTLKKQGFRVQADLRNEKITYKIREHSVQKVPYIIVVGDKEREANTVAVRARGNADLGVMSVDSLVERLQQEIAAKA